MATLKHLEKINFDHKKKKENYFILWESEVLEKFNSILGANFVAFV